jgi:hypothetical protein
MHGTIGTVNGCGVHFYHRLGEKHSVRGVFARLDSGDPVVVRAGAIAPVSSSSQYAGSVGKRVQTKEKPPCR